LGAASPAARGLLLASTAHAIAQFLTRSPKTEPLRVPSPFGDGRAGEPRLSRRWRIPQSLCFRRGLVVHGAAGNICPRSAENARAPPSLSEPQGLAPHDARNPHPKRSPSSLFPVFASCSPRKEPIRCGVTAHNLPISQGRISGPIDRLAVTRGGCPDRDFKTNRPAPTHRESTPARGGPLYRTQMALYRAALQKIYPCKLNRFAPV